MNANHPQLDLAIEKLIECYKNGGKPAELSEILIEAPET